MRKLAIAAVALSMSGLLGLLLLPVLLLSVLTGAAAAQACGGQQTGTPVSAIPTGRPASAQTMSPTQLSNARVIVAVGEQLQMSQQAIVIALAVASQESTFLNYANDGLGNDLLPEQRGVDRSQVFPNDAVGSDNGSVNAFQQQFPWWGTLEQLMDPPTAARLFYDALRKVPNFETLPLTEAAQRVQRSAYPAAYADDEPLARELYAQLAGSGGLAAEPDETPGEAVPIGLCGTGVALNCPPTEYLNVEVGLSPDALRVLRCVQQTFGDHTYIGVGAREDNPRSDHPAGRAVDIMIDAWQTPAGNTSGRLIAEWVAQNAAALGAKYVIFDGLIWTNGQPPDSWAPYIHPKGLTDPNSMHRNHVHVSVFGNAAQTGGALSAAGWMFPLPSGSYRLSSAFGPRQSPGGIGSTVHAGVDLAAPSGTTVYAAATGTVTYAGPSGGSGNLVVITTGNVETYYAHLLDASITVTRGQQVAAGDSVAAVGSTGNSTGPHLHFETRLNGVPQDPISFLAQYGIDP